MIRDALFQFGLPILVEIMLPLVMGAISAGIIYVITWWRKLTGYQVDEAARQRITEATERAVRYGIQMLLLKKGIMNPSQMSREDRVQVLHDAAGYMATFNPGDIQKFGLNSLPKLQARLMPLMPIPADDPPVVPPKADTAS